MNPTSKIPVISRQVWILCWISFFTDVASEMLYPILPLYLSSIGYSFGWIGLLEGCAEATAGLSKGGFGKWSDASGKRVPFIQLGYALSAISKPLLVAFRSIGWIFFARTLDRFGKGIRTGARDALLSDEATPETKGRIFGIHRAMDTSGAILGPVLALALMDTLELSYSSLFLISAIPGICTVGLSWFLREKEKPKEETPVSEKNGFFDIFVYWKSSPKKYKTIVLLLLLFALANSSDLFLLFRVKQVLSSDRSMISVYVFYNLIYALFAFPFGYIADRIGLKRILSLGLILFAVSYGGMGSAKELYEFVILFFIYGMYSAATEGVAKALISNTIPSSEAASALGTYAGLQSICLLVASVFAGWAWENVGPNFVFVFSASVAGVVGIGVLALRVEKEELQSN
ncbi:MFS transporter [Leptospira wolffii]|uniref:MFS transporter n=1 Tax=Leptospira wolffii TaxID=409998 RepID=UPI0010847662|nr:MFS transporter [Leptospira wolffii]TGL45280.1 MFS transporter [Leptospira wolffii]